MNDRMIFKRVLAMFCMLSVFCVTWSSTASAYTVTPTTLPGGQIITARTAKTLFDAKTAVFIDVRSDIRYSAGHIPGASHVQYVQHSLKTTTFDATLDQFDLTALPATKSTPIVFYSNSINGWRPYKAAILAIKQGYTNVRWLRGGMTEWVAGRYAVEKTVAGI